MLYYWVQCVYAYILYMMHSSNFESVVLCSEDNKNKQIKKIFIVLHITHTRSLFVESWLRSVWICCMIWYDMLLICAFVFALFCCCCNNTWNRKSTIAPQLKNSQCCSSFLFSCIYYKTTYYFYVYCNVILYNMCWWTFKCAIVFIL
jgi:hypothetical protein